VVFGHASTSLQTGKLVDRFRTGLTLVLDDASRVEHAESVTTPARPVLDASSRTRVRPVLDLQ
jgi:hypothetical protein